MRLPQNNCVYNFSQSRIVRHYRPNQELIPMKILIRSSAVLLGLVLTGATASYCQSSAPDQGTGDHKFRHHGPNAEFETKFLTRKLGLSPEEASQVEPILASQDEQLKALRPAQGTQPDFKALHEQRKAIFEATEKQLAGVLTSEQLVEYQKIHHFGGPGGPHGNWQGKSGSGN
jgi:hypothetical protein